MSNAFLRVPVRLVPFVIKALKDNGHEAVADDVAEFTKHYTHPDFNAVRRDWISRADDTVAKDGVIEFDSDATISDSSDNGQYVLGWVWVDGDKETNECES